MELLTKEIRAKLPPLFLCEEVNIINGSRH